MHQVLKSARVNRLSLVLRHLNPLVSLVPHRCLHTNVPSFHKKRIVLLSPTTYGDKIAQVLSATLKIPVTNLAKEAPLAALPTPSILSIQSPKEYKHGNDIVVVLLDTFQASAPSTGLDYDFRVIVPRGESETSVAQKVIAELSKSQTYVSTRDWSYEKKDVSFESVVIHGLASDRGLFVPQKWTKFTLPELESLISLPYQHRVLRVLERFPLGGVVPKALFEMTQQAYASFNHPSILPVSHLEGSQYLLEEFHGPTASFKDLSLQLTPRILSHSLQLSSKKDIQLCMLTATSGDTGTAALDGFGRGTTFPMVVLYPKDGVSEVQKAQMVTATGNVCVIGVDADFDFCQNTVKDIFNDVGLLQEWKQLVPNLHLSSANSINWGRFLPQIVFSISAYCDLVKRNVIRMGDVVDICVPTGNFGNILGAVWAKKLGLPIGRLICASNSNNILTDFIKTGKYDLRGRKFTTTVSPAIDILISSNVERLLWLLSDGDAEQVSRLMKDLAEKQYFEVTGQLKTTITELFEAWWCGEEQCLETIQGVFNRTKTFIDPHTAVAKYVADQLASSSLSFSSGSRPLLISSTAHWSKFPDAMLKALNLPLPQSKGSEAMMDMLHRLNSCKPKNPIHPQVEALATKKVVHNTTCGARKQEIIHHISTFLKGLSK